MNTVDWKRGCQTRELKHLSSQACVGIFLRSPPISCRQGRYTRETDCGLDSRTSIMYRCEHKTCAKTLVRESRHKFSVGHVPKFNNRTSKPSSSSLLHTMGRAIALRWDIHANLGSLIL